MESEIHVSRAHQTSTNATSNTDDSSGNTSRGGKKKDSGPLGDERRRNKYKEKYFSATALS